VNYNKCAKLINTVHYIISLSEIIYLCFLYLVRLVPKYVTSYDSRVYRTSLRLAGT
jgi:hypothetical protein